jgi:hypothetical protein
VIGFTIIVAGLVGAVVGGVVGLLSGIVLAVCRASVIGNRRRARLIALATSAAPFVLLGLLWLVEGEPGVTGIYLALGLLSGAAGAVLGPQVVHGWAPAGSRQPWSPRDGHPGVGVWPPG